MNVRIVVNVLGKILRLESFLLILPWLVSLFYRESTGLTWMLCIGICYATGQLLTLIKPKSEVFFAREGLAIVALSWIVMSVFGSLPFMMTGAIPAFHDALFETVSGFTTTGASVLSDVEVLPHSVLFWRSFTNMIGGMGVLVFALAILPKVNKHSLHILRAESPGPMVGKLVAKLSDTARILYLIYLGLTLLEIVFLLLAGMPLFDSVVTAFASAGTGGFSVKNASIGHYGSNAVDLIIGVFIILFGVNFTVYHYLLSKELRLIGRNEEVRLYFGIIAASVALIAINIRPLYQTGLKAGIDAFFQVASIITTTGFSNVDFDQWPVFSKSLLVTLMFIGACAGSTGGGLKISRILILAKSALEHLRKAALPNRVVPPLMDGKPIPTGLTRAVGVYLFTYICIFGMAVLMLTFDNVDMTTAFSAVASAINNIGPGLELVGPTKNFAHFSIFTKQVLTWCMLMGRLELLPVLILFLPNTWRRK